MELHNIIVGAKLNEIQKRSDGIKLVFENTKTHKVYTLNFKGLLFETSASTINRRVKNIELNSTLGFRATTQLRHLKRDLGNYRQLYIQMEGSDDNNKIELLGALSQYSLLPRPLALVSKKASPKKASSKKATRKNK